MPKGIQNEKETKIIEMPLVESPDRLYGNEINLTRLGGVSSKTVVTGRFP